MEQKSNTTMIESVQHSEQGFKTPPLQGKDRAAQLLNNAGQHIIVTPEESARILRKIDLVILPILLIVYCLQYLDKATLSYASVFGLITDTHLHGQEYSWLGSIVYVAQLVMQPAIAFFLVKFPIGKFAATMVLGWGIILCCMVAATNFTGLVTARFFLGAFEASVAPTFIAITQMWWRRGEQTNRTAAWYSMLGVVNMVGSLLSYGLGHISSPKLHSYQIIFLFCGSITVVFSIVIFIFMPDSPMEAKFLKHEEKLIAVERLRANQMGIASRVWKWEHLRESFLDVKTWFWFCMIFSISVPSGGVSTFGPLIVKSFGYDSFHTILLNIPFGAVQLVATLGSAYLATRYKRKGPMLIGLCIPPIIGCSMLIAIEHDKSHKGVLLFAYYLISFYPGITPLIYSWSAQNTAGDTKRKCTTGFLFIGASAGNILGPNLYRTTEAPRYLRGLVSNLILFIVLICLIILCTLYLTFLNRQHAKTRERMGKSGKVVDWSMEDKRDVGIQEGGVNASGGDRDKAFDDTTDLKNEDFIFTY